jgi:hypothetical protein
MAVDSRDQVVVRAQVFRAGREHRARLVDRCIETAFGRLAEDS